MKRAILIAAGIIVAIITLSIAAGNLIVQVALQAAWKALTPEQRKTLGPTKDAIKRQIETADLRAAEQ